MYEGSVFNPVFIGFPFAVAPLRCEHNPLIKIARDGMQIAAPENACSNVSPSAASRSIFGVRTTFAPYTGESKNPWSSAKNNTRCGLLLWATAPIPAAAKNPRRVIPSISCTSITQTV